VVLELEHIHLVRRKQRAGAFEDQRVPTLQ